MKRALVTGATGFVGHHLVRSLLNSGWSVVCVLRDAHRLPDIDRQQVTIVETDIADIEQHSEIFEDVDYVFHLAAKTHDLSAKELHRVNASGTEAIAKVASAAKVPPVFIQVSSLAANGPSPTGQPCNETTRARPVSNYGRTKLAAEKFLRSCAERMPVTIVRPGVIFGGRDDGTWQLMAPIVNLGIHLVPGWNQRRLSIVHIDDFVRALMLIATRGERMEAGTSETSGSGIYCVGTNEQPTYAELGKIIGQVVGRRRVFNLRIANWAMRIICLIAESIKQVKQKSAILGVDKARELVAPNWTCDITKITKLGFAPARTLAERWQETAAWYRDHGFIRASDDRPEQIVEQPAFSAKQSESSV